MKRAACILLVTLAASVSACLWDMDTLAEEARNQMDLVRIITGRFERNPPLYYQMRLDRVSKELVKAPANLDNYDNAAVACDRLAHDEDAIVWIEKKRAYMTAHGETPKTNPDDWYRYYANAGTFHAHLWFRRGAKPAEKSEVAKGCELLRQAIELNPNAHFGRERMQIKVLEWAMGDRNAPLSSYVSNDQESKESLQRDAKGLAGLIMLGNAWESVDTFTALQDRLSNASDGSLAQFAMLRAKELVAKGAKPLSKEGDDLYQYPYLRPTDSTADFNNDEFKRLRAEADKWQTSRTEFMLARLKQGRHPDTDPQFWSDYKERPAPDIRSQWFHLNEADIEVLTVNAMILTVIVVIGLPLFVIVKVVRFLKRRRAG